MEEQGGDDILSWREMGILRLLSTLGGLAAILTGSAFITCSSATGLGLLWSVPIGVLAFGAVMGTGAPATILTIFVLDLLMIFVPDDDTKARVYLAIRWLVFLGVAGALLWIGGRGVYDGLQNNRLTDPQVLYERCMAPQTRTVQDRWQECSDGWASPSIGHRGACSHHGGVVWRMIERRERYLPHDAAYCHADATTRSWVD